MERTGADGTILEVPIDPNGSPAMLVGIVKEFDSRLEHKSGQSVRSGAAVALFQRQRTAEHVLEQLRLLVFLKNPAPMLPRDRIPTSNRRKREYRLGRDQPLGILWDHGLKFAQEQQRQLDRDAAG